MGGNSWKAAKATGKARGERVAVRANWVRVVEGLSTSRVIEPPQAAHTGVVWGRRVWGAMVLTRHWGCEGRVIGVHGPPGTVGRGHWGGGQRGIAGDQRRKPRSALLVCGDGLDQPPWKVHACPVAVPDGSRRPVQRVHADETTVLFVRQMARHLTVGLDRHETGLLNSVNFVDCDLSYSVFIGLTLRKMIVTKCVAKDVDFAEADLTQADFTYTDLAESQFLHTNLTEADFTHARNYWIDAGLNTLKQARFSLPEAIALLRSMNIVLVE